MIFIFIYILYGFYEYNQKILNEDIKRKITDTQ